MLATRLKRGSRKPAKHLPNRRWTFDELVAEVVSPESRRRDRIEKRDLHEQHGVREYWILDPQAGTVEMLFLERDEYGLVGRWRPGEKARSQLLKGFSVAVTGLFAKDQ